MTNFYRPASLDQFSEGSILSHYHFLERIGRGGEADVWSAWDTQGNRVVAIKLVVTAREAGLSTIQFNREAHLVAQLFHPNIMPLYDYGELSGLRFLVMRYMVSGSLLLQIGSHPLRPDMFAQIAHPVAEALDFVHANGIVHRDLKPGNILLDSRQVPFLTDFGLARQLSTGSTLPIHTPEGTLPYMSPEQLRSEPITSRSDLFSLGILLFEMLTGRLPLEGKMSLALHQQQTGEPLEDPVQHNRALPPGTVEILRQLTANDPHERPQTAAEAVEQLQKLLDKTPVQFTGPSHDQTEDARDMLSVVLKTWTPSTERYPFMLTEFELVGKQCIYHPDYPVFLSSEASQILLYGALYYKRSSADVDYWWQKTPEDNRRAVCWALILQTANALDVPAISQVFALAKTLPPTASLPTKVGERLIALAKLNVDSVSDKALDLLVHWFDAPVDAWRYSKTPLDTLLVALVNDNSALISVAVKAIIQTRSGGALRDIVAQPDRRRTRRVLAEVWVAAGSLPSGVPWWLRAQTLLRICYDQLTERPLAVLADFLLLTLACFLALGTFLNVTRRLPLSEIFNSRRLFNALAPGLLFGVEIALGLLVAHTLSERLRILPSLVRVALAALLGSLITTWAFAQLHLLFYDLPPDSPLLLPGAFLFAVGFALNRGFKRALVRAAIAGAGILAGILLTWLIYLQTGDPPLLYFDENNTPWEILFLALLFALTVGLVSQSGDWWRRALRTIFSSTESQNFTKNSVI